VDLAQRILEVARQSEWTTGCRMSEQQLASQCNVSRTPIRKALQMLAQQGAVAPDPDGGYRLAVDPTESQHSTPPLPSSEEEELFRAIVRDLAARRIPVSQTVIGLQRRYGASRLTVQNALQKLMEERVVERAAGQQWLLKPLIVGAEALGYSDEFRLLMEPAALLTPGFKIDSAALAALRQGLELLARMDESRFDLPLFERMGVEFHRLIARGCGNPFIEDALLNHQLRRSHVTPPATSVFRMREAANEQLNILTQIELEQMALAADLLRAHLRLSGTQRPRMLGRGVPQMLRSAPG
jgi:DNA-binding GntR family transcriptional regulator